VLTQNVMLTSNKTNGVRTFLSALCGFFQMTDYDVIEGIVGVDSNGNKIPPDPTNTNTYKANVYLFRMNPAGLDIEETRKKY